MKGKKQGLFEKSPSPPPPHVHVPPPAPDTTSCEVPTAALTLGARRIAPPAPPPPPPIPHPPPHTALETPISLTPCCSGARAAREPQALSRCVEALGLALGALMQSPGEDVRGVDDG